MMNRYFGDHQRLPQIHAASGAEGWILGVV